MITDATRVIGGRDGGKLDEGEAVDADADADADADDMPAVLATAAAAVAAVPPILPLERGRCATTW